MEKTVSKREEMIKFVEGQLKKLSMLDLQVLMENKKEESLVRIGKGLNFGDLELFLNKDGYLMLETSRFAGYEIEMAFYIWATRIGMTKRVRDVEFIKDIQEFKKILQEKYGEVGQNIAICIRCGQLTDYTIDELINGELRK